MCMAFVVEDGTGLANATSYGSVAELGSYWLDLGIDMSQYLPGVKEAGLVAASQHIDLFFGHRLLGFKETYEQALEFPRIYLYDSCGRIIEGVPTKIKHAVFEYAQRVIVNKKPLVADPVVDVTGYQVLSTFKKVGPLEKRTTFTGSARATLTPYPKADAFLKDFISSSGGSFRA